MDAEMKFAWIPPGTFLMGGNGVADHPQHRATISKGFWMGIFPRHPLAGRVGYNPSNFRGGNRPVEMVSWLDSQEFCQKMAGPTSKPIKLPTDAEWEYACRAGSTSEYWTGNREDSLNAVAWYKGNRNEQTKPVGNLAANPWGFYDAFGNVWEWCQDWKGTLGTENQTDPTRQANGSDRIIRGGAWERAFGGCLAASHNNRVPGVREAYVGLRVCFRLD